MTDSFTQTPNYVFDLMSELTPAEFKTVMVIVRATHGHHLGQARISISLFVEMTGLTRQGVFNCIESLLSKNIIERIEVKNSFEYRLSPFNSVEQNHSTQLNETVNSVEQNSEEKDENRSTELNENKDEKTENVQLSRTKSFNSVDPLNKKEITTEAYASAFAEAKDPAPTPPKPKTREPTEHQRYFAKVCEIVGWDFQTITDGQKGQVAQTVGVLQKAAYTYEELNRFKPEVWVNDWRWAKKKQYPTLSDLRAEIGKLRNGSHAVVPEVVTNGKLDFSMGELLK